MYFQITTRCNMTCPHCCFDCITEGDDMTLETFEKALYWSTGYVCIGGGEPTMHKDFEKMLLMTIASEGVEAGSVGVITNGTHVKRSLLIHGLTQKGIIQGEMSEDSFHDRDMVKKEVSNKFFKSGNIRNIQVQTANGVLGAGRGITELGLPPGCVCDSPLIQPDGNVRYCGCLDAPIIGNVYTGWQNPYPYSSNSCYRDLEDEDEDKEDAA